MRYFLCLFSLLFMATSVFAQKEVPGKVMIYLNGWEREAKIPPGRTPGIKIDPGNMSPYTGTKVGSRIYTPLNPTLPGGFRGKIVDVPSKVLGVMALYQQFPNVSALGAEGSLAKNAKNANQDMKAPIYLAELADDNSFVFQGLPAGKYDLFVMCENCFFEGFALSREENTLKEADVKAIKKKITESNPFFNVKHQHRIEGTHGAYGKARILEQEVRTKTLVLQSAEVVTGVQIRSIKVCMMESVGSKRIGSFWEMKKTREICRQEIGPLETKGVIPNYFRKSLQGIRVSRRMKDLGELSLQQGEAGK